jgi:hypothetical protein
MQAASATAKAVQQRPPTCTAPTPAAIKVDDDIALDRPPAAAGVAAAVLPAATAVLLVLPATSLTVLLLLLLLLLMVPLLPAAAVVVATAAAARAAARATASRPAAAATELVVTDSSGTLKSLVVVLNTDRATPTPASCVAPAQHKHTKGVTAQHHTHKAWPSMPHGGSRGGDKGCVT